jgi:hypothetical protein
MAYVWSEKCPCKPICILDGSRGSYSPLHHACNGGRSSGGIKGILHAVAVPRT